MGSDTQQRSSGLGFEPATRVQAALVAGTWTARPAGDPLQSILYLRLKSEAWPGEAFSHYLSVITSRC